MDIDTSRLRTGLPQVGVQPYRQVHAHSTGNRNSTVQNEADYHWRKDPELGFFSHIVGNGCIMQVGPVDNGAWDVGGGWNAETYAAVELIESHSTKEEFMTDYRLYAI
ncbi:autolysin [Streptococcus pneumoniae]|nr:autolysin [Streptococcus pneumoniae]